MQIETRGGAIRAKVWRVKVGRCDLLLLDSNVEGNAPEDRELTSRLYGGDARIRIRQELLLGVGGFRALQAMGITPGVLHLNEGHSGFAVLEAIRSRMQDEGIELRRRPCRACRREVVFTTHTPVPAGHDRFDCGLDRRASRPAARSAGPLARTADGAGPRESRQPARRVLHDRAGAEALAARQRGFGAARRSLARDVDRALSGQAGGRSSHRPHHQRRARAVAGWRRRCSGSTTAISAPAGTSTAARRSIWEGIENVDDGELWETHLSLKSRLLEFVRRRAVEQAERRGESPEMLQRLGRVLSPDALTIGFARRFATYKRANLILARYRKAGLDGQRSEAAGAVRFRRQGASARRARQARAAADRRS